jgi:hypothetical protein
LTLQQLGGLAEYILVAKILIGVPIVGAKPAFLSPPQVGRLVIEGFNALAHPRPGPLVTPIYIHSGENIFKKLI